MVTSADVEVHDVAEMPDAGVYRGQHQARVWAEGMLRLVDEWRFRSAGDEGVIALFRIVVRGKGSGIEIGRDDAIVYRVKEGRIERMQYFNDQQRALKAAVLQG